jgi:hypothetical protein
VFRDAGIHTYMKEHATLHTLIPAEIPILHPGYRCQYQSTQHNSGFYLLHAGFLLGLVFDTEDVGDVFCQNVG